MKGLLKFCFEATKGEDAPDISDPEKVLNDMEPQRRRWLEEALGSMSVDIVQQLTNGIKILNSEAEDEVKEEVLDQLEDWLGNIDMAVNFHKVGGLPSLQRCLASSSPGVRAGACNLVAEISQNNPYCQHQLAEEGWLQLLLAQLDSDTHPSCRVKALYAISCMARDSPPLLAKLGALDGWSVVLRAVQRGEEKLTTKGCYLLGCAARASEAAAAQMVEMGMVAQLAGSLHAEFSPAHEQLLGALLALATVSPAARTEARDAGLGLEQLLLARRRELGGREEHLESAEHCEALLRLLAPDFVPTESWQEVQEWQAVPPGCHVKVDLQTGKKMARREEQTADR